MQSDEQYVKEKCVIANVNHSVLGWYVIYRVKDDPKVQETGYHKRQTLAWRSAAARIRAERGEK